MARTRWLVLAALVAIAGVALFLRLAGGERRTAGPARPAAEHAREPGTARDPAELAPARAPELTPPAPAETRARAAREELAQESDPAPPTFAVQIVEAATQRPLANADVWFRPREDWSVARLEQLVEGATHAQADARGMVRIPRSAGDRLLVLARSGTLFGADEFSNDAGEPTGGTPRKLELHPDWDVAVLVLDAALHPAPGLRVELGWQAGYNSSDSGAETDADGRVLFRHVGLELAQNPARAFRVRVDLPLVEELAADLAREGAPAEPIRFVLPPLGSVEVTLLDERGEPAEDGSEVELGIVQPGEPRDISPFASRHRQRIRRETVRGQARFGYVELGGEVELLASLPGSSMHTKDYFSGPRLAGERVARTLVLGLDHPLLVFRAVDTSGQALASTELSLRTWSRSGWMINQDERATTTDAEGRFRVELPASYSQGEHRLLFVLASAGALGARLELSRPFERGTNALGDLVLAPPPLVAAGRVIDGAGKPVPGTEIRFQSPVRESEDSEQVWYWNDADLHARTDESGAFSASGFVTGDLLKLVAEHEGLQSAPLETAVGTAGLRLVLLGTGWVAGALLVDEGVPLDELRVTLRRGGGPEQEGQEEQETSWSGRNQVSPKEDGHFRIEAQLPGLYTLSVELENDERLVEITGITVVPGAGSEDPRLSAIDLRSRLHVARLTLVPPRPDPNLRGNLTYVPSGDAQAGERWKYFYQNPFIVLTQHERIDARLFVQGYRVEELTELSGDRRVELRPALTVRLVLPAEIDLPEPPSYFKAALAPADGEHMIDWGGGAFDETREIRCFASAAGRMKVVWIYERRAENGATASMVSIEPEQIVEVLDQAGEQRFELRVSNEALARVLAEPPF